MGACLLGRRCGLLGIRFRGGRGRRLRRFRNLEVGKRVSWEIVSGMIWKNRGRPVSVNSSSSSTANSGPSWGC